MTEPFEHAPALGGAHAEAGPDPGAPMLGGPGAPPPPPLYRPDRDLSRLADLGLYLAKRGRTGYVPALEAAEDYVERLLGREQTDQEPGAR